MTKRLFTGGDWPTWLVATGASSGFLAGLFVFWGVFAEPMHEQSPQTPVAISEIAERVKSIEQENEELKKRILALEKANEQAKSVIETCLVSAKILTLTDDKGQDRVAISTLLGDPIFEVMRADKSLAFRLGEMDGDVGLYLFDTAAQGRVGLDVTKDGKAMVRVFDERNKPRLGLISTPGGEVEFTRVDKFGNVVVK